MQNITHKNIKQYIIPTLNIHNKNMDLIMQNIMFPLYNKYMICNIQRRKLKSPYNLYDMEYMFDFNFILSL